MGGHRKWEGVGNGSNYINLILGVCNKLHGVRRNILKSGSGVSFYFQSFTSFLFGSEFQSSLKVSTC